MPLVELSVHWIILLDIVAWAVFHMGISFLTLSMPEKWFASDGWLYRIKKWEREGRLWQDFFRVKSWKGLIPDGSSVMGAGYNKKELPGRDTTSLIQFITESRRAELTHWLSILPAGFFFIWNPLWASYIMVIYALLFNLPIIIAQRYNRGRLEKLVVYRNKKAAR
ncbi:glycosyl-4,4'-diaponeurosporenoate acyltransferase [Oceanobacillus kapialis]|uniref:glycosyl-4,4'-diaponeurosporenoate acyltransferase CrtO family protein n=1 Tax=Oceanobacillus kapialis TaxID=481353 RepID=UPI00384D6A50